MLLANTNRSRLSQATGVGGNWNPAASDMLRSVRMRNSGMKRRLPYTRQAGVQPRALHHSRGSGLRT
jgi:hypothetical protein